MRIIFYIAIVVICLGVLHDCDAESQELTASYYSVASCKREGTWQRWGGLMANGKQFKDENKTAASWDYAFGKKLRVTNTRNGKSVVVEVTDRGPNKKLYRKGRVIDLSISSFAAIANIKEGIIPVRIEEV